MTPVWQAALIQKRKMNSHQWTKSGIDDFDPIARSDYRAVVWAKWRGKMRHKKAFG